MSYRSACILGHSSVNGEGMPRKSKQKKKTKSNCREKTKGAGKLLYSESESGNHDGLASGK